MSAFSGGLWQLDSKKTPLRVISMIHLNSTIIRVICKTGVIKSGEDMSWHSWGKLHPSLAKEVSLLLAYDSDPFVLYSIWVGSTTSYSDSIKNEVVNCVSKIFIFSFFRL